MIIGNKENIEVGGNDSWLSSMHNHYRCAFKIVEVRCVSRSVYLELAFIKDVTFQLYRLNGARCYIFDKCVFGIRATVTR